MEVFSDPPTIDVFVDGIGMCKMIVSYEFLQDQEMLQAIFDSDRTGPIHDWEIKEWQEMDEKIDTFDKQKIIEKYKVQFFRENCFGRVYEPYEWYNRKWDSDEEGEEPPPNHEWEH